MAPGFASLDASQPCPCGGGLYRHCCAPFHQGQRKPETAVALMRSRYSAFALAELNYLIATHPQLEFSHRERRRQLRSSCGPAEWRGLTILSTTAGGVDDLEGTVSFEARHRSEVLRETSLFQHRDGLRSGDWLYISALDLEA